MGLMEIVKAIKSGGCKRLVKQTGNEIEVKGASFGIGDFKIMLAIFQTRYNNSIRSLKPLLLLITLNSYCVKQ
jgi:hypothetical protein